MIVARLLDHHKELNEQGIGKCSVPMWCGGLPADFCDRDAYGERPAGKTLTRWDGREFREDGRYAGYVPALACPDHGGPTTRVFKDGNMWCAVEQDFIDLHDSPAGFGETPALAREELMWEKRKADALTSTKSVPK